MDLRNIAIIAHVDHGKTTLVDELLKQSGTYRENQATTERAMDSNDLERERGITILAKATSVEWQGHRINIVDTPGHADFGGEVERILSMVDGVVLLVDAAEGPMPQTKFVTSKALALGLRPIVVLNKVDKPDAEPDRALDECFDLFANLGADDAQLDFPHMYASGRNGWADMELDGPRKDLSALFELVLKHVPAPKQIAARDEPFRMLATTLGADPFIGRILTGRVESGTLKAGEGAERVCYFNDKETQFLKEKMIDYSPETMTFTNTVYQAGKFPLDPEYTRAFYSVKDLGNGTSELTFHMKYRTKPAMMGSMAKGKFKRLIGQYFVAIEHHAKTGQSVTKDNFKDIKKLYAKL